MARILIVYGTTEGHTRSIARRIAATVMAHGHLPTVVDATEPRITTDACDACIVCAPVHQGKHPSAVMHFVHDNCPGHIFLVAGALKYTEYDFMKRILMSLIAQRNGADTDTTHDYEYTDWTRLRDDTVTFLASARLAIETRHEAAALVAAGPMLN